MEFIFSILLLYFGSESLVKGSSSLALRLKISPLIIGLTFLSFSTSSSELFVSVKAALEGHGDLSAGNVVGSNIFTVAGILGVCACIHPIEIKKQLLKLDLPVMLGAYGLLSCFALLGFVSRMEGALLVFLLAAYTAAIYQIHRRQKQTIEAETVEAIGKPLKNLWVDLLACAFGLGALLYGADLFVASSVSYAKVWGLSEAAIGLTLVAIGTSLPELTCCLVALKQKKFDLLAGNLIGSNIFNVLGVLGPSAIAGPLTISGIRLLDIGWMFGTAIFLYFGKMSLISRVKGAILALSYCAYVYFAL